MRKLPAYPLFVKDPYFSIWSTGEQLNSVNTSFWHGEEKPLYGTIVVDGKEYLFLGNNPKIEKMSQYSLELKAFSTIYKFDCQDVKLNVEFVSPLPPDNIELASCPVCFMRYKIFPKHFIEKVEIHLMAEERLCYNTCYQENRRMDTRSGVLKTDNFECAYLGLLRQMPMSHSADEFGADWGYYYLAGQNCLTKNENDFFYIEAVNYYHNVNNEISGEFLIGFDDCVSIFYYGEWLKGYYFRNGKTIIDALNDSFLNKSFIYDICEKFDKQLNEQSKKYGENYTLILYASLRQSMGAHKIVQDKKGRVLFLSKECNSDGCIATVDVSYPSAPLYLLYNPELVNSMLYPIFDFARMNIWNYDFAPHDAGIYPYCLGQLYGAINQDNKYNKDIFVRDWQKQESVPMYYQFPKGSDIYTFEKQMPVEECGNMLILTATANIAGGDKHIIEENFDLLRKWAKYLERDGLIPENQLCTDDFAGHLPKNSNLSLKANFGLIAFAYICHVMNYSQLEQEYIKKAVEHSKQWMKICFKDKKPTSLTMNGPDATYSLKYNLVFDKLFKSELYPSEIRENEVDCYIEKLNKYGVPLDSRAEYTKSDWMMWAACLSDNKDKVEKIINSIAEFLKTSPDRVPFSDWYDTKTGKFHMFRNRTVQGGLFIILLAESGKIELPEKFKEKLNKARY